MAKKNEREEDDNINQMCTYAHSQRLCAMVEWLLNKLGILRYIFKAFHHYHYYLYTKKK